jgi:2',3'-cyclic-nucleotide 2'-phosphodiesterase/3'-nucleotidase
MIGTVRDTALPHRAGLRLLATSDLHVHLHSWDYFADQPSPGVGLARTAALIRSARAEVANTLLFDNGDFLDGSPMGDLIAAQHRSGHNPTHPVITAMNLLNYDAVTIGNHEFAHGLDYLTSRLQSANFPVVSTNLLTLRGDDPHADQPLFAGDLLLEREITGHNGENYLIRVGVLGFAPVQTAAWEHHVLQGTLATRDILEAAAARLPQLKAQGADIVVALSHSGIGSGTAAPLMENATAALARLDGIDVLIAGHTHQRFPDPSFPPGPGIDPMAGTLWGKPAVMPGFYGSHLGVIDLALERGTAGWRIAGHRSQLRAISKRTETGVMEPLIAADPAVAAATEADHAATRHWSAQRIGETGSDLHSFFSLVAACPAVRLVARAMRDYVEAALRGTVHEGIPVLAAAAPFRAGGRGGPENYTFVPRGPISLRNLADLYYHPNAIAAVALTGSEVRGWLERSVSQFHQIAPGAVDAELVDKRFPSFNFDSIEGLTWRVDLSRPARFDSHGVLLDRQAQRITELCHEGRPVRPTDRFIVATNSYRTSGSGFTGASAERVILSRPEQCRDILHHYIAAHDPLPPPDPPNWGFVPMQGTSVTFDSAPLAAAHVADVPELRLEPMTRCPIGFLRFRLHL